MDVTLALGLIASQSKEWPMDLHRSLLSVLSQ